MIMLLENQLVFHTVLLKLPSKRILVCLQLRHRHCGNISEFTKLKIDIRPIDQIYYLLWIQLKNAQDFSPGRSFSAYVGVALKLIG